MMKDSDEQFTSLTPSRKLSDAVRDVKNAFADRDDVVVDMREAHRMRLELLAAELAPGFADGPPGLGKFRLRRPAALGHFRFRRPAGLAPAAVDRRRQPCRHGARPPHLPIPQGYPHRPRR